MSQPRLIFDRALLRERRLRAKALGPSTFLIDQVAQDLADRLAAVVRRFECAVDLGTPTDAVCRQLARSGKIDTFIAASRSIADVLPPQGAEQSPFFRLAIAADEEALPFRDGSLDLVVSALSLQCVNDLPGTLVQIRRALRSDGLLLAALAGGDSLTELRECFAGAEAEIEGGTSPHVIPFVDVRAAGALLQRAGFALPVTDLDRMTVRYSSPMALMHDIRAMGATNPLIERSRHPLKRATLRRMIELYGQRFADPDQRIRATFEIVWLSGWAPHSSQQKPLTPGSARQRLADALGAREVTITERDEGQTGESR
jgi:SAM-dependent methyltransferase